VQFWSLPLTNVYRRDAEVVEKRITRIFLGDVGVSAVELGFFVK
jgi:hypothetical protein